MIPLARIAFLVMGVASLLPVMSLHAGVISYFRFEVDLDGDDTNGSVISPDEADPTAPNFISNSADLDASANPGSLPNDVVPFTGAPNNKSLDGTPLDINGTVAYNDALDVASLTVELWARTEESTAVLIGRSTETTPNGIESGINDGFRIYDPADLKVDYYVSDGVTTQMITLDANTGMDNVGSRGDGNTNWRHVAFAYDATTGTGSLYLDGTVVASNSLGSSGYDLYWGGASAQPIVQIGALMDGYNFSKSSADNGFIDEVRFSDNALEEEELLINPVPEPGTVFGGLLLLGLVLGYHCFQRRKHAEDSD